MMRHVDGPVTVIGGINMDTLARVTGPGTDARTSNPGRTHRSPGGVGRNVAEALARLGSPVRLMGAVGEDTEGTVLLDGLREVGVDVTGVRRCADSTGTYTAVLDDRGDLVVGVADMNATERIAPDDLDPDWLAQSSWLVLDGNLPRATIARALLIARARKVPAVLDPVGVAKSARLGALPGLHTFTPTGQELQAWSSAADPIAHAHAQGVCVVWVRDGAAGSTLHPAGQAPIPLRLPPAEVVDVTGAGDTALAAYVHRLRGGASLAEAGWFAAAAGWLAVGAAEAVRTDLSEDLVEKTRAELTG